MLGLHLCLSLRDNCEAVGHNMAAERPQEGQNYTDKKENQIFLIYKELQNGAVANI